LAQRQAIIGQIALLDDRHHRRGEENNAGRDQLVENRDRVRNAPPSAKDENKHFDGHKERNQDQQENHQPPTGTQLGGVEEDAVHGAWRRLLDGTDRSVGRQSDLAIQKS